MSIIPAAQRPRPPRGRVGILGITAAAGYGVFGAVSLAAFSDPLLIASLTGGALTLILLVLALAIERRSARWVGLAFSAVTVLGAGLIGLRSIREMGAERQQESRMIEIGISFHHYLHKNGDRFPPAAHRGADGTPLLSWRVMILPYINREDLYREFHLEEPWDSPHNLSFLPRMPEPYLSFLPTGVEDPPYSTRCQVLVGRGTPFDGPVGLKIRSDFPDSLSQTLLLVEARTPVPWTKPEDIPYNPDGPLPAFAPVVPRSLCGRVFGTGRPEGIVLGMMADGSSSSAGRLKPEWSEADIRKLIERHNGVPGDR